MLVKIAHLNLNNLFHTLKQVDHLVVNKDQEVNPFLTVNTLTQCLKLLIKISICMILMTRMINAQINSLIQIWGLKENLIQNLKNQVNLPNQIDLEKECCSWIDKTNRLDNRIFFINRNKKLKNCRNWNNNRLEDKILQMKWRIN